MAGEEGNRPDDTRRTRRLRTALPILERILAPAGVGLLGAWLGMLVAGNLSAEVGPFTVRLSANFGPGVTEVVLPPFGRLTADTHLAPLRFRTTLTDVDGLELIEFVRDMSPDQAVRQIERDLLPRIQPFALRLLGVALAGALTLSVLVFRWSRRALGSSLLATLLIVGGGEALAWQTYRPAELLSPTFSGTLALAPGLVGPVETALDRVSQFRGELRRIVSGASRVFAGIEGNPFVDEDEVRVLHISDIHLSPLGLEFAQRVADAFDVDFVVDTGDLTSFGTPAEDVIASFVPQFGRPYVFVRGNHDSLGLQAAMARVPNAIVLDGTTAEVEGIVIYGVGDVLFTPDQESSPTEEEQAALFEAASERLLGDLLALPEPPDLVAVHNDREALTAAGRVPLVIAGHDHVPSARVMEGTLFLRIGTTGGSGAGVFAEEGGIPLSAQILHFDPADGSLIAYDLIEQSPETGNVTLTRYLVDEEFGELEPSPSPTPTSSPSPVPATPPSPGSPASVPTG